MTEVAVEPQTGWVPVERRWLGFDRRTNLPAVVVLVVAAVMALVLPAVDRAVPNDDRVRSGDVIQVAVVRFTPVVGFRIDSGLRAGRPESNGDYPSDASISNGSLSFTVRTDAYRGTPARLLTKIRTTNNKLTADGTLRIDNPTRSITTGTGLSGVISRYSSSKTDGIIAAFVADDVGIEVTATAAAGDLDAQAIRNVAAMIVSIRTAPGAS